LPALAALIRLTRLIRFAACSAISLARIALLTRRTASVALVLIVSHLWLRSYLAEAKRHWAATAEIIARKIHTFSSKPQQRSPNAEFMPSIFMARRRRRT
jgi:hypothetical protein